ncbi:cytochrome c peroxidase [Flavobacteriaceae bacterium M23B6Z8]
MKRFICLALIVIYFFVGCVSDRKEESNHVNWSIAHNFYEKELQRSISYIDTLAQHTSNDSLSRKYFKLLRIAFKRAEPYASYLNPPVGHRVNGPALPVFKEDNGKVLAPVGLQKIEESIYEKETLIDQYQNELRITRGMLENLLKNIKKRPLNPHRFFIATHQQLLRIISLGITGFDTPISQLGLEESIVSLEGLKYVYKNSIQFLIKERDHELDMQFLVHLNDAIQYLKKNPDFEKFDRFTFIRDYMNAITRDWVAIRKKSNIWQSVDTTPFNFEAPTFFEEDAFNVAYFMPSFNKTSSTAQIELGRKLFYDHNLSSGKKMACVTCHDPKKAFADGLVVNYDNDGKPLKRNTPTLINAVFQKGFFWDGRADHLMDQIASVFTNEKEFDSQVHTFSVDILRDSSYVKMFERSFGSVPKKNTAIIKALSSYIATLNAFNSKFDRNIRGEQATFTELEKEGFNLYMGKALCATCHFIPLTNGTVPPFYLETEKEVIGVPETAANIQLDDDLGFYWRFEEELHKGMFKTPTVRNTSVTAPYMHNGVYKNMEEVVDFYNKGGGGGLGFDLEHQTLPFDKLELTQHEIKALIAFIDTLTDTVVD